MLNPIGKGLNRVMTRRLLIRLVAVMTSVGFCVPQANSPSVEGLMTAAEFRESGLTKLSSTELAALNRWLGKYPSSLSIP